MNLPRILLDADSCPKKVRDYLVIYSQKLNLPIIFAANRNIPPVISTTFFTMALCTKEKGSADDYIVEQAAGNDIVITRDIPLASRLVEKKITVMNDRGTFFSSENIKERLSERNFSLQLAQLGLGGSKKKIYSQKDFMEFANSFDKKIHELIQAAHH
ncbi:MAG: DUF188 domain-containing protein [Treponema sp.]|jgi:uncharacterized protein YaiI (UPF0178 family)|nr:DUF188 domain-containing protein [Treponema sp.]